MFPACRGEVQPAQPSGKVVKSLGFQHVWGLGFRVLGVLGCGIKAKEQIQHNLEP